ncbi:VOC family protein [Marinomonas sp. TI.3.20]|uniref:VOC family protein n=1 Tax=Marinomonas sp. TI.3.20 TaxID=3121296 RepID=UPI00311D44A1
MLLGVTLGTNNLTKASAFYDAVLRTLNMVRTMTVDGEVGYGVVGGASCFWVLTPFNKQQATIGNGVQVTFQASNNDEVEAFYRTALACGGTDEGAPGYRYRPNYFGAYCRDLDGNKLHVMYEN